MYSDSQDFSQFVKQQQQAFQDTSQIQKPVQISETGKEGNPEGEIKIGDYETYSTDSDADKEEQNPLKELICELVISDRNCLAIPYALASDHFPPMIIHPNAKETLNLLDPLHREWRMTLVYNSDAHAYVITHGWTHYIEHYHLNPPDLIQFHKPVPQEEFNCFYIQHQKPFGMPLFEVSIPRSNRFPIPRDMARQYFNPSRAPPPPKHLWEYPLHLRDHLGNVWEMYYIIFEEEQAYIVVRGWDKYVAHYGLSYKDTVRFFNHNPPGENSFIIFHELTRWDPFTPILCRPDILFCELVLSEADVVSGKLKMPGVKIPFECRGKEMVKLTDKDNKNWYLMIVFPRVSSKYMIFDGWEGIVREHNLEAGDVVRFYIPANPDHVKHFVIKCAKKKQLMIEKEKGGSGSGKQLRQKNFGMPLFEVSIPRSIRLPIPSDVAGQYFDPSESPPVPRHLREYPLTLTDSLGSVWEMRYIVSKEEKAYIVVRGWDKYVTLYGLSYKDTVKFFNHNPPEKNRFVIFHELTGWDYFTPPLCMPDILLCELILSQTDVEFGRLKMPDVKLPFDCRGKEMVKLTDEDDKIWYVIIVYPRNSSEFMIIDGWEGIVREHELEAGDVVRFYIPVNPDHGKHFVIECAKKKQMMTEKEEGSSGSGKPVDDAKPSQDVSRKGEEIAI